MNKANIYWGKNFNYLFLFLGTKFENQNFLFRLKLGHQRYKSDETANLSIPNNLNSSANSSTSTLNFSSSSTSSKKPFKKALAMLNLERNVDPKDIDYKEIIDKLKLALENYERFSFIAFVEFECVIRAANVYRMQRLYIETEVRVLFWNNYKRHQA